MSWQPGGEILPAEPETCSIYGELRYFTTSSAPETMAGTTGLKRQKESHMQLFHSGGAAKYTEVRLKIANLCLKSFAPNTVFKSCVLVLTPLLGRHRQPSPSTWKWICVGTAHGGRVEALTGAKCGVFVGVR